MRITAQELSSDNEGRYPMVRFSIGTEIPTFKVVVPFFRAVGRPARVDET